MYLLHPVLDRTDVMVFQNVYWPGIRNTLYKEVNNCNTLKCTKRSNQKHGKLPAK